MITEFTDYPSTLVQAARYSSERRQMHVALLASYVMDGGEIPLVVYDYEDVAPEAWEQFESAQSHGYHFTRYIRPNYIGRKTEAVTL